MAKLILSIQPKDKGALKSVQALKAEVLSLSKSLSSIKVAASGVETTRKGYANLITTLKTLKSQYADGVFGKLPQDAERAFKKIQEISAAFQKNGTLTKEQAKAYAQLSQQLKKYTADLATVKAKNDKIVAANPFTVTQAQQIPRLIKQYSTLLSTIKNTEKYYPKGTFDTFKADLTQGQQKLQALNQEFQTTGTLSQSSQTQLNNLANGFNQLNASVAQTTSIMKSSKGSLKDIVTGFLKFQVAAMLVMKPLQWIRSALSSINETLVKTEDAVIALQRVLPSGSASDSEISSRLYKVAQDYGQTFENVSQIATNFARTGMSWADTIKATEAAVLALNVAELDATEASEGLISILTQFGMTADQLTEIVDKLNKAADKNPVTTEKLLTALQRTGAAAKNANITLDETIGIITTLSKATNRSGENLGTAVNSLIQFSSKESSLNTFAKFGGDVETAVEKFRAGAGSILEIWEELGEVIQNRQGEAESILGGGLFNNEEWASLNDELKEALGESYADVTEIYNTASVFRRNYFVALLNDMVNVKKVTDDIADANGYSQAENEKALQTYTKRLNSLKAQWQDLANSEQGLLGIKKALVDIGSVLLTIIKWTGGLRTTLLAISTVVWMLVGDKIIAGFKAIGTAIKGLVTGLRTATTAAQGLQAALGWIGAIATVISLIVGIAQQAQEESRKDYTEGIVNAKNALDELAQNIESATEKYENYKKSIQEARAILGDESSTTSQIANAKETLLSIQNALTQSNSDYADSIDVINGNLQTQLGLLDKLNEEQARKQVQEYIRLNKDKIENAKSYLSETFDEIATGESGRLYGGLTDENFLLTDWLNGTQGSDHFWKGFGEGFLSVFGKEISGYVQFDEAKTREQIIAWLEDQYDKAESAENKDELQARIRSLIGSFQNDAYNASYGMIRGDENSSDWIERLSEEQRELFAEGKLTLDQIREILGEEKKIDATSKDWHNNIAKVADQYDDLISKLKELRDAEKESLELEEKKQAVLEAQRALENARNEATVRRFNEATGQWEWQTDEKAIAEAEENLEEAQQDLEEQAYKSIIDQLENNTATNEGLNKLLDGLKDFLGEKFIQDIKAAIKGTTNVDLDQPVKSYDSGGIASGMGFMPKATDKPETVNNPDLTAKILSPVSNDQFHRYVRDMGLLFETSRQYAQTPVIERVGGATDNSVNNSGQVIIKDVNVGAEQRDNLLGILALGGIVPNV